MKITRLTTQAYRLPLSRPAGRTPLATAASRPRGPESVDVLVTRVEAESHFGLGVTSLYGPGTSTVRSLLENELPSFLLGEDARMTERLHARAMRYFGDLGFQGPVARAYAGVDAALWDLKARSAGISLSELLGPVRETVPHFVSDVPNADWRPEEVAKTTKAAVKQGAIGVRVEIGMGTVNDDADRVRELRELLGEDIWVGVSASGRYDLNTALALARFFDDQGLDWFEDPIPASDYSGYARIADRFDILLAVGSSFDRVDDFHRVIRDGLARVVRPDPLRLGGLTPLLAIGQVAEAYHVGVAPVRSPELAFPFALAQRAVGHVELTPWRNELLEAPLDGSTWTLKESAKSFLVD